MNAIVSENQRKMTPPASILVFGASAHIGGPLAERIVKEFPQTKLRLATSSDAKASELRIKFPGAEIVVASYLNLPSLLEALDGIEGLFIVTPDFLDELTAMTNIVAAVRHVGTVKHIVRIMGDPPHVHSEADLSKKLIQWDIGTAIQHMRARRVLQPSGLPITYINIASYYMDNFLRMMSHGIRKKRTLYMPFDRHMNYIDAPDVGKAAAGVLMSGDTFHFGKTYHVDNGVDCITFFEVAKMMSDVFGEHIEYNDSPEDFLTECKEDFEKAYGPGALEYMLDYVQWEQTADTIWRRTDLFESLFKFTPRTLREWFGANKNAFLNEATK